MNQNHFYFPTSHETIDPIKTMLDWIESAKAEEQYNAMTLATVSPDGHPDARIVLFRGYDHNGLHFYTNYNSPKSEHLLKHPAATCLFFWPGLMRQIRVFGTVRKTSDEQSDSYFAARPILSQLASSLSKQSQPLPEGGHKELMRRFDEEQKKMNIDNKSLTKSISIPRPPHWGGWALKPEKIEFWLCGDHRMHQRIQFRKIPPSSDWVGVELYP